jgi:phosphoglycerate dehydrogenase-like enzyme
MSTRPLVILTEPIDVVSRDWLAARVDLVEASPGADAFAQALPDAAGLVVRTATEVNEVMLARATNLQAVARAGVGLDNIDQDACRSRGITVLHTPDANTQSVAEYVMTLVLDALRPRDVLLDAVSQDIWDQLRSAARGCRQMNECRFGILGFGRIGRRVAKMASAIGFELSYTDVLTIDPAHRHGAAPVSLAELLSTSDVLSIHVDGRASNHGLLTAELISLLPDDALLVNTSRGFVMDSHALSDQLRSTPTFQAILDVHEHEPIPDDYPLLGLSNATLLPHNAARTTTALKNMSRVVENLARHLGVD